MRCLLGRRYKFIFYLIEPLILNIRDQRVILDSDLAFLYGVETRSLNQAITRNKSRFPEEFAFRLSKGELQNLISQNVISISYGGVRKLPLVFTEHGALMAANVLRSKQAVRVSIEVIKAFVRLRNVYMSVENFSKKVDELEEKQNDQDKDIKLINNSKKIELYNPNNRTCHPEFISGSYKDGRDGDLTILR